MCVGFDGRLHAPIWPEVVLVRSTRTRDRRTRQSTSGVDSRLSLQPDTSIPKHQEISRPKPCTGSPERQTWPPKPGSRIPDPESRIDRTRIANPENRERRFRRSSSKRVARSWRRCPRLWTSKWLSSTPLASTRCVSRPSKCHCPVFDLFRGCS